MDKREEMGGTEVASYTYLSCFSLTQFAVPCGNILENLLPSPRMMLLFTVTMQRWGGAFFMYAHLLWMKNPIKD